MIILSKNILRFFKRLANVRLALFALLLLASAFCAWRAYDKVVYWGFGLNSKKATSVWSVEAHVSFEATGEPIKVSLAVPGEDGRYKVLGEDVVAPGYSVYRVEGKGNRNGRAVVSAPAGRQGVQDIYYQLVIFDARKGAGKVRADVPRAPEAPLFDDQQTAMAKEVWKKAARFDGDKVQQLVSVLNEPAGDPAVAAFLPVNRNPKEMVEALKSLLAFKGIASRTIRGLKLEENRKPSSPDLMLEAYVGGAWRMYDIASGKQGVGKDFVVFQKGGESLLDVEGGVDSQIQFSAMRSVSNTAKMAGQRAKLAGDPGWFEYSIYDLPLAQQNSLKWLMIFPLGIFVVAAMRNVVGLKTMGTFTPMLLAMSLVKTGLWQGLACFAAVIASGLLIRAVLSRLNLLLVPRISAVVIFVILIIQAMMIAGYKLDLNIASSAAFFPIIITAWIIERASITWEEEGRSGALWEIFWTLFVAVIVFCVVNSASIRYIMFAFNELNLVILVLVMLLGTYTGYRLTELRRFSPLAVKKPGKGKKKGV